MELYKTVRKQAEAVQMIDKSRFIAHVFPVESREEADAFLAEIREKYKDATHNVPAMVIGDKSQIQWASDDGEPQGTSGAPMVQMMVKEGLTNLIVVVTRYFGGIKLGTGGLVRAYTSSAKLGLEAAGVCSVREMAELTVKIDYPYLAKIQNMASEQLDLEEADREGEENLSNFRIANIQYTDKIEMKIQTFPGSLTNVELLFQNITSGKAEVISQTTVREKV
ncbi:MAG: YigZ family protein [Clostridia bacterium]